MMFRVHRYPASDSLLGDVFGFEREIDNLFDTVLGTATSSRRTHYPAIDVAEHETESVLVAEVPGVKKEDLKISVENGMLTIQGERKSQSLPERSRWIRNEVETGEFRRVFELPHAVDANKVSAELENGVLRVVLPKPEQVRPREIKVN